MKKTQIVVPDLTQRVVEQTELVDGQDAERYNDACDYPETSDYGIVAEILAMDSDLTDKDVLEIGSGPGNLCQEILGKGAKTVVGVDAAETMIEHASRNHLNHGGRIRFDQESVYELPYEDGSYDVVVCHNSFHQLHDPFTAIKEMVRVTRNGGRVIVYDFRRDVPEEPFRERVSWTKPEIRQELADSICAALTKEEFRALLGEIPGISFSVTDAIDPSSLTPRVDKLIENDPIPHFMDYLVSQRVKIYKG